jgi:hypothetical protein
MKFTLKRIYHLIRVTGILKDCQKRSETEWGNATSVDDRTNK